MKREKTGWPRMVHPARTVAYLVRVGPEEDGQWAATEASAHAFAERLLAADGDLDRVLVHRIEEHSVVAR